MQELDIAIDKLVSEMLSRGYARDSIGYYRRIFDRLTAFAKLRHFANAERALVAFEKESLSKYESGRISLPRHQSQANLVARIRNVLMGKAVIWRTNRVVTPVSKDFSKALGAIASSGNWTSDGVKRGVISALRTMFAWFDQHGMSDLSDLTRETVLRYYIEKSASIKHVVGMRSRLVLGLSTARSLGLISFDSSVIFKLRIPTRVRFRPAISDEAIARVIDGINLKTELGRRDYAMILLGLDSGLRPVDITNIRLSDVNWRDGSISIVQHKTAQPLGLPLSFGVIEAMKEYALNWRPRSNCRYLFVSCRPPRGKMDAKTPGARFARYAKKAGIDRQADHVVTFYGMRRRLGRNLATNRIPMTTVAQVLGHNGLKSAEHYMSLSPTVLAECALDFTGIEPGGAR